MLLNIEKTPRQNLILVGESRPREEVDLMHMKPNVPIECERMRYA